jgi:hypothetical protein
MGLDKEDFVAIRTAHREQVLMAERVKLEKEIDGVSATIDGARKELAQLQEKTVKDLVAKEQKRVAGPLKKLGYGEVKVGWRAWEDWERGHHKEPAKNVVVLHVAQQGEQRGQLTKKITVKYPAKIKTLEATMEKLEGQKQRLQLQLIDVKRDLANIGMEERLSRAQLAAKKLERTAAGRELLAEIKGSKSLTYSGV